MEKKNIYTIIIILLLILLLLISIYYYNNIPIPNQTEEEAKTAILNFVSNTYTVDDITTPKWDKK